MPARDVYHDRLEPERILYLAVDINTFEGIFSEPIGELMLENDRLKLLVFDQNKEVLIKWIPPINTNK